MNDTVIYRPYKTQTWALVFTLPVGIFAFMAAGYCLSLSGIGTICLTIIGIVCTWLTKALYDASKRAVSFDKNGLRMIGGSCFEYQYIPWEKLTHAYYARSYKGHLFLILSADALSHTKAKHFANQGANSSRICIDGIVVIYIDILQDVSQLRELIDNQVLRVDTY